MNSIVLEETEEDYAVTVNSDGTLVVHAREDITYNWTYDQLSQNVRIFFSDTNNTALFDHNIRGVILKLIAQSELEKSLFDS